MDPIKLAGIRDWPTPTTVKQVRSFLGFGNYYQKFISGFAHLTRPLHDLEPIRVPDVQCVPMGLMLSIPAHQLISCDI